MSRASETAVDFRADGRATVRCCDVKQQRAFRIAYESKAPITISDVDGVWLVVGIAYAGSTAFFDLELVGSVQ